MVKADPVVVPPLNAADNRFIRSLPEKLFHGTDLDAVLFCRDGMGTNRREYYERYINIS